MMNIAPRRRLRAAGIGIALTASLFALAGCSSTADQQRIAELEQKVAQLEGSSGAEGSSTGSADATASSPAGDANSGTTANTATTATVDEALKASWPELADYEARVAAAEQECASVTRSDDMSANYQSYLEKKNVLDTIEREMDAFDDAREYEAKTGGLDYADYLALERAIDLLDDRLDYAKDGMELTLGVDD